jgi:hypothetical protein
MKAFFPYLIRNHLFVHRGAPASLRPKSDPQRVIDFPSNVSNVSEAALKNIAIDRRSLSARVDQGDLIGLYYAEGRLVHRSLLQTRGIAAMEGDPRAFPLGSGKAYIHYCYTASDFRGRGAYSEMLIHIAARNWVGEKPAEIYIACRADNKPSIKGILRAGFQYVKSGSVIGIFRGRVRVRRWFLSPELGRRDMSANDT